MTSEDNDVEWFVYQESIFDRVFRAGGWVYGWLLYRLARLGFTDFAARHVDRAIALRRDNPGAVRLLGYLNGMAGRMAVRRGSLMIRGTMKPAGPFASQRYFATYHVAAVNKDRALSLIKRFENDAVASSITIEEGELDLPDDGAEGVLWVAPGRTFVGPEEADA